MDGETQAKAICVFCASSDGNNLKYAQAAIELGEAIARRGSTLVYGGGTSGLMGVTAAACLNAGGKVHGVIPEALTKRERFFTTAANIQVPQNLLTPTLEQDATPEAKSIVSVVKTMHERKMKMATLSDAFVSLPGGFGTLEELAEMTTWSQLAIHSKPTILLNTLEFYSPLRNFIDGALESGFIPPKNRGFMVFVDAAPGQDWGAAALDAVDRWRSDGANGAEPYKLEWS